MKSAYHPAGPVMDIGIAAQDRADIAAGLSRLLADNEGGHLTAEQVKFAQTIHDAGNDLLEVELDSGGQQPLLIPFVQAIVPSVHLEEGWIGITPPPGLLELADPRERSDPPPRS